MKPSLTDIRREYGHLELSKDKMNACPIAQFEAWFEEIISTETYDPTAMVLSTADEHGHPDARLVLLKGIEDGGFFFYTNYDSAKARQIKINPFVALTFYWPSMARQVRIRGQVVLTSTAQSDDYFFSRPLASQWSAVISHQSTPLNNRSALESALQTYCANNTPPSERPSYWGGYIVYPETMEFWQGRDNRLHDRMSYTKDKGVWQLVSLAP